MDTRSNVVLLATMVWFFLEMQAEIWVTQAVCWIKAKEIILGHSILSLESSLSGTCDVERMVRVVGLQTNYRLLGFDYAWVGSITRTRSYDAAHGRLSTTEASYIDTSEAAKEAIGLKGLFDWSGAKLKIALSEAVRDLPELQVLILKSNIFHGPVKIASSSELPFPSLRVLDLSYNRFVGHLPHNYFQNLHVMKNMLMNATGPEYMNFYGKYYSIVVVVKGQQLLFQKISVIYTIVDLSNNRFEGVIPNVIGSLNSLKVLNLSHNNLNGRIPHALGNLSQIESLDLSWNQLIGEIPQSLADITTLEVLNLSQNHLVGRIPQGKQFSTFEGSSFGGNSGLCGFPLPMKCEHPSFPRVESDDGDEGESGFTWKVVVLGYGCGTLLGLVMGYLMLSSTRPNWFNAITYAWENMILNRQNRRRYVFIGR
ncbi:hypothetical protein CTI12_AA511270 [Artemisia annua]|uniref:Leucine-rich repeat domain, L domain-like protein n=1 Tax=Artemisia annua TaxID=35608 RepID=A0A2U1LAW0_ARTAN|nr:hypothetical protein CTI12_AA511270 [Artemisia annua]